MADGPQFSVHALRVGIVEDQDEIVQLLQYNLQAAGFIVEIMTTGDEAELKLDEQPPDVLILDWMLPGVSGIELLRRLRRRPKTRNLPVIVLTARKDEADLIRALETGADDYVAKPFSPKELVARVATLARRRLPHKLAPMLSAGDIEFDRESMCVKRSGKVIHLAPTDYRLLEVFLQNMGRVLSRSDILDSVWGDGVFIDERTIDVHVGRLRKALLATDKHDPIKTIRSAGYRFDPQ
jgi:two-component system, OmpR family, phosphate regulon response regulator PhoB